MRPRPANAVIQGLPPDRELVATLWQAHLESTEDDAPSFLTSRLSVLTGLERAMAPDGGDSATAAVSGRTVCNSR